MAASTPSLAFLAIAAPAARRETLDGLGAKPGKCAAPRAPEAVNRGADVYAVKQWLGHSEIATTERYAKLRPVPIARVLPG